MASGAFSRLSRSTGLRLRTSSQVASGRSRVGCVTAIEARKVTHLATKSKVTFGIEGIRPNGGPVMTALDRSDDRFLHSRVRPLRRTQVAPNRAEIGHEAPVARGTLDPTQT